MEPTGIALIVETAQDIVTFVIGSVKDIGAMVVRAECERHEVGGWMGFFGYLAGCRLNGENQLFEPGIHLGLPPKSF